MNTALGTGDAPLSPGFLAWREMCAKNPEFDVARLFARGNPHMDARGVRRLQRAVSRSRPSRGTAGVSAHGARTAGRRTARPFRAQAREFWSKQWTGQTMMAVGAQDPVLGLPVMQALRQIIRGCPEPMVLEQAGHFVQEHGEPIARAAVGYFRP